MWIKLFDRANLRSARAGALLGLATLMLLAGAPSAIAAGCPNEEFRTGFSAKLPDCRAYEKVSPDDKGGTDVQASPIGAGAAGFVAAENGEAAIYTALNGVLAGAESAPTTLFYRAERTGSGWLTRGIDPALDVGYPTATTEHPFYTPNLSAQVFDTGTSLQGGRPAGIYRQGFDGGALEWLAPPSGLVETSLGSEDAETLAWLVTGQQPTLSTSSGLQSITVPGGTNYKIGGGTGTGANTSAALSAGGSRLYFSAEASSPLELYLWEGGSTSLVSQPNQGVTDPHGPKPATFGWASRDGRRAFFVSAAKLTADATTGPADEGADLYEFDAGAAPGEKLRDLTVDGADPSGARVQTIIGGGRDGAFVYFTALGKIGAGETPGHEAIPGELNLYVTHAGTTKFIATVEPHPSPEIFPFAQTPSLPITERFWVTGNGAHLVFQTKYPQPGYQNNGFDEVYIYDAETGELHCASCNPSGKGATANSTIGEENFYLVTGPGHARDANEAGTEVYFNSEEALVEGDTNGRTDVYEYENGEPKLISSGTGSGPSLLFGASADGRDVFFGTRQRLVAGDDDDIIDVYDARRGGGLVEATGTTAGCAGEECRGAQSAAPAAVMAGSESLQGPGNQAHTKRKQHHKHKKKQQKKKHKQRRKGGHAHAHKGGVK